MKSLESYAKNLVNGVTTKYEAALCSEMVSAFEQIYEV
jgi:hypothetical protein